MHAVFTGDVGQVIVGNVAGVGPRRKMIPARAITVRVGALRTPARRPPVKGKESR